MKGIDASRWLLAAALALGAAQAAQAQNYPNRQIKMILPFAAGGAAIPSRARWRRRCRSRSDSRW